MTATGYLTIPVVLGAVFLLWALAARRSPFDAVMIGLAGLLLLVIGLREHFPALLERQLGIWPELILGLLGLGMLLRMFLSRLGWPHRAGLGLAGCAVTLPLLLLISLMALFSMGSGHDYHRPPAANEAEANKS